MNVNSISYLDAWFEDKLDEDNLGGCSFRLFAEMIFLLI